LQGGAAFQQKQFRIGGERVESVHMPLTIETNFSLTILGQIHSAKMAEEFRELAVRPSI